MKKTLFFFFTAVILVAAVYLIRQKLWQPKQDVSPAITNFAGCAAAGNPVMESYPRQCRDKGGRVFVEEIPTDQAAITTGTGGPGIMPYDSGVKGTVTLAPVCPVERIPPDPACAPKPYQTIVQVIRVGSPSSSPFATVETDEAGRYEVKLPPGGYALQPVGGRPLPRCETKEVTVEPGVIAAADLSCDTGIR